MHTYAAGNPSIEQIDTTSTEVQSADSLHKWVSHKDWKVAKEGYINKGDQMYWWHDAHFMGKNEKLMNNGYTTEWAISPQYTNVSRKFGEDLAAVEVNGKVGYIDRKNRFIILPRFEPHKFLHGFQNGLSPFIKDGKFGFADKRGEVLIPAQFEEVEPFLDNHIAFVKLRGKYGAIDLKGDTLIPCIHTTPKSMITVTKNIPDWKRVDSLVQARISEGYYDKELQQILNAEVYSDSLINDPLFRNTVPTGLSIMTMDGKKGISHDETWIVSPDYDNIIPTENGYYILIKGIHQGICDSFGRIILSCDFSEVQYDIDGNLFIVKDGLGRYGIYSSTGAMILPPCLDGIDPYCGEYAICHIGNTYGLIDRNAQMISDDFYSGILNEAMNLTGLKRQNALRQIIAFKPTFAQAHNNLGVTYTNAEEYKKGIPMLRLAHKLDPNDSVIAENFKQAKADRRDRNLERTAFAFTVLAAVAGVAVTTMDAVSTVQSGGTYSSGSTYSSGGAYSGGTSSKNQKLTQELNAKADKTEKEARDLHNRQTETKVYWSYVEQLQDMNRYYTTKYNDSQRQKIQRTMKSIRQKWENKGYTSGERFPYVPEWENWDGTHRQ